MFTSKKIKIERAFTIQNVSIKFGEDEKYSQFSMTFTIQNVSIKCFNLTVLLFCNFNLQYKMFLLNLVFLKLPI